MKPISHSWKQEGSISLWRYTENERNYPGWHLSADTRGCSSLSSLLQSLAADGDGAARAIALEPPTASVLAIPNNRGGQAKFRAPAKLRVRFVRDPRLWSFPKTLEPAELAFGYDWLAPLKQGLDAISQGQGDYSIGIDHDGNLPLWFWWRRAAA
jgi:hypothetical protein